MVPPRIGIFLAAACCAVACGDRPDPPGPAVSNGSAPGPQAPSGAGSTSGTLDRPGDDDEAAPAAPPPSDPPADEPTAAGADAGLAPAAPVADDDEEDPPSLGAGQTIAACTDDGGGCLIMNIALSDVGDDSCTQLILDNCESSAQAGLRVDLPVSWRLGSASVSSSSDDCLPGTQFNPQTGSTIITASGSIDWDVSTRVPSQIVLDLTLQPASSARGPVRITNSDLVDPLLECD